jgi:hypothetical protein
MRRFVRVTGTVHSEDTGSSDHRDRRCFYKPPDRTSRHPPRSPSTSEYPRTASPRERRRAERRSPTHNCCHIPARANMSRWCYPHRACSTPGARPRFEKCIVCRLDRNRVRERRRAHRCRSRDHRLCRNRTRHRIGTPCQAGVGRPPIQRTPVRLRIRRTNFLQNLPFGCRPPSRRPSQRR